jgi:ligand-binding SRPBCC domain-containing protein
MPFRLERTTLIPRAREEVFAFFAEAGNLELLTPPFLNFSILTPQPISMNEGTLIDYRIGLFGVPLRWHTRIETFDPPSSFVDVQLSGPYRLWRHRHEFISVPEGTRMHDHVDYALPFGPLAPIVRSLVVRRTLDRIFDYRTAAIERIFKESAPNSR